MNDFVGTLAANPAYALLNRVRFTTPTTGNGLTLVVGSAVPGYTTITGLADGAQVGYSIEEGINFETGVGTYHTAAGGTLDRVTVETSSAAGARITLAGSATVFVTITSAMLGGNSLAFVQSDNAQLTGGSVTGMSAIGLSTGDVIQTSTDGRVPGFAERWLDAAGNMFAGIMNDGTLMWTGISCTAVNTTTLGVTTLTVTTGTITTLNATTGTIATLNATNATVSGTLTGTMAQYKIPAGDGFQALPGQLSMHFAMAFMDPAGNIPGGILPDGSWRWNTANLDTLTVNTSATVANLHAVVATIDTLTGSLPQYLLANGDGFLPADPRIGNLFAAVYYDGQGDIFATIDPLGVLYWQNIKCATITVDTIQTSGPFAPQSINMGGDNFGTLDGRLIGVGYAFQDGQGNTFGYYDQNGYFNTLALVPDPTLPQEPVNLRYMQANAITSAGGQITGQLLLPASTPTNSNQAASKAYVDASAASGGGGGLVGLTAQKDYPYPPLRDPKRDYGAVGDGIADDSVPINNCVAATIAAGERIIAINDVYNCPHLDWSIAQVLLVGIGRLVNANIQMFVIPPFAPSAPSILPNRTLYLNSHCPKTAAKLRAQQPTDPPVVVVVTGESTYAPSTSTTVLPIFWARSQFSFREANPNKNIQFYNRGIGGTRWDQLDTTPLWGNIDDPTVSWYTDGARPWLDYIHDLNPDIVMIGFSGNDGLAFRLQWMISVLGKLAAWVNPPEVILATSNPYAQQYLTNQANTVVGWEGQQAVAMMERSWAISKGLGLVDTSRAITIHAKGFDPAEMPLKRDFVPTGGQVNSRKAFNLPFSWPSRVWGYAGMFYIPAGGWPALGHEVQFELGITWGGGTYPNITPNALNAGCILRVGRDNTSKQIYYEVDTAQTSMGAGVNHVHIPKTFVPNWFSDDALPFSFNFSVSGSRLNLQSYGGNNPNHDQWVANIQVLVPRYNQPWFPKITCAAGSVVNGLWWEKAGDGYAYAASGTPDQRAFYMPSMTEHEAYGGNETPESGWSGGGVGHDSALKGIWAIQCALNSCHWGA